MKWLTSVAVLTMFCTASWAETRQYTLDPEHTTVAFLVDHIGFAKTLGYFSEVSGSFNFDTESGQVSDLSVEVQTESLQTDNEARDKHVRNKDFLHVKKYPTMMFQAADAMVDAQGNGSIEGELTLLDKTLPLSLEVTLNKAEKYPFGHKKFTLGVSARGSLKRSEFGMDYGVANGLVGDVVDLIIEIEAIQE